MSASNGLYESWIENAISNQHIQLFSHGDFKNKDNCGKGGLGQIKRADWQYLDGKVALKELLDYNIKRFVQEVKMHISCHWSEYVVRFFGLTKESPNNKYMMVMEYANFKSLRNFLKVKGVTNIDWEVKFKLSLDIAKGLNCLHSRKIIHRDLHTDNIVINQIFWKTSCCQPEFIAKITDFGEAIFKDEILNENGGFGQPEFTDPNYLDRGIKRDERSDIYGLGVIFWEISSGKMPFEKYARDSGNDILLLTIQIISGKREKVPEETPECYSLLYRDCWNLDQSKRPTLEKIIKVLNKSVSNAEDIEDASTLSFDEETNNESDNNELNIEYLGFLIKDT
ncbi:5178_t:CDS:2 [Funneliformis geosporum]|uniref:14819_t:CDS:1 n=1 Tax=Funneliformis geosporum TaxID=1117311 RepID=A0A9W4SSF5_9GLOM|nr:14819_t:CDS:2 [Funneliformis geosporum]CAI2179911.1 5178_t:CDS:2 [Funneliformis geosporum]